MKLKVYQQGGGLIYTPFIPEQWAGQGAARSSGSNGSDDDGKIDPLDKELIALMKDQNLLPSDIQMIYNKLIQFQRKSRDLTIDGDYRSVMPGMLQIMQLTSIAKANKQHWDNALEEIKKHDAGSEIALDSYGRMWVREKDTDKITKITPEEYTSEKYNPVSNSELMFMRQRDPNLAFSDDVLDSVISDVVGQKDVRNEINDVIDSFGKMSNSKFALGSKIKDIAGDVLEGDIYKVKSSYSKADLYDFSELLFSQLSRGSQNLLRARSAMAGQDLRDYITNIIFSQTDRDVDFSYEASATKALNGDSNGDGSKSLVQTTYAEHLVWGDFDHGKRELLQPGDSDLAIYAYVQDVGPIKKDDNDFGSANLDKVFTQADAIGTLIDKNGIYFGDYKVQSSDFSKIMYDNRRNMKRAELPIKEDGSIDFELQQKVDKITEYLKRNEGMVPDDLIEEQLEDSPNAYWDREHKVVRFKNSKVFFVIDAIASSEKVNFNTESPYVHWMEKEPGDSRKDYMNMYNNAINSGYANVPKDGKKDPYNNGESAGRHLYRGNLYMPLSGQVIATALYNHERLPVENYMAGTPTNMAALNEDRKKVRSNF